MYSYIYIRTCNSCFLPRSWIENTRNYYKIRRVLLKFCTVITAVEGICKYCGRVLYSYFVDRASRYKFLLITNLTHFFMYLFISSLYTYQASQCSLSEDRIVLIHRLVWLFCVSDCLLCRSWPPYQGVTQTNHTRWCINTIRSSDNEHCDARNMYRDEINKYMRKCVKLVINKNLLW